MNVLLLTPTYPPYNSGLGNAAYQQARLFILEGHSVTVATGGSKRSSRVDNYINIETFNITGVDLWFKPIIGDIESFYDFIVQENWDIVILNGWQNWATDIALRNLIDIPGKKYLYSHCISTNTFFKHQITKSLVRYIIWRQYWWRLPKYFKKLDGIIFLSTAGSDTRFDDLVIANKYPLKKYFIPNSISESATNVLNKPLIPFEDREIIIAIGSYTWLKGFDFVIRAFSESKARFDYPLHLYGQNFTSYTTYLQKLAKRLGLNTNQVIFHENVSGEELIKANSRALVLLFGSHTECQPLVLLDSIATGTPYIARRTGAIHTILGGINVTNTNSMKLELENLASNKNSWNKLANEGRSAALKIYHPKVISRQLNELTHK